MNNFNHLKPDDIIMLNYLFHNYHGYFYQIIKIVDADHAIVRGRDVNLINFDYLRFIKWLDIENNKFEKSYDCEFIDDTLEDGMCDCSGNIHVKGGIRCRLGL